MCRFNEYPGFTWFSCHAGFAGGFVRLLLDGCCGRWFVYVKQRNATASCSPIQIWPSCCFFVPSAASLAALGTKKQQEGQIWIGLQRHAEHCVQAARALCWERISLTGIPVGNQSDQGNIPDAVTWACVRGKNMHSMKARFVLLICKLSPGLSRCSISCRKLVWWAPWDLPILVTGLEGVYVQKYGSVLVSHGYTLGLHTIVS